MDFIVNATSIEALLWSIQCELMQRHGVDAAAREIAPLRWYVQTGRASVDFIKALARKSPCMVARRLHKGRRRLHKGGSDAEVIQRIKEYIGYKEEG